MTNKKTLLSLLVVGGILFGAYSVYHYSPDSPVSIMQPGTTYTDEEVTARTDSPRTEPVKQQSTETVQSVLADPQTILTERPVTKRSSAPKQVETRESTAKEFVYYPLLTANDPSYATNWAVQQVNAPAAWDITTGSEDTIVAVIDSGFALNHEDLTTRWAINANESGTTVLGDRCWTGTSADKRTNSCDDDNNGYVDDWRGWNFYLSDNNVMTGRTNPAGAGVSHGTETSGLAGASGNNGLGGTTIAWNTKVMPLQALSDDGPGYTSDVTAAIYYAVDNGADVINLSLGGEQYDPAMAAATNYAYANNVVVIAAAGNCGSGGAGCESVPVGAMSYPAKNPHVISVGASTQTTARASFSSYGPDLDITAPGSGSIVSPTWQSSNTTSLYATQMYGTSYASPIVASMAALIKSVRPDSTTDDIAALLLATATKPTGMNGALYTTQYGHGIINAQSAVTIAQTLNSSSSTPTLAQVGGVASEHTFKSTDSIGSGCQAFASSYCTVRFFDKTQGNERYLPYKATSTDGKIGWTWPGSFLSAGEWQVRAVQGDAISDTPYILFQK